LKPAPAFQCYAGNLITNKQYRLMAPIERSVWISIYLECWTNDSVPADPIELAKFLHFSIEDVKAGLTKRVLFFFEEVKGELICPEHKEYREKLRLRNLKKSIGGKKGAERKRYMASSRIGNDEGTPRGTPKGSLIQSKLNQTNQTQSIKEDSVPVDDPWVNDYEKASKGY